MIYICLHDWGILMVNITIYIAYMDPMGNNSFIQRHAPFRNAHFRSTRKVTHLESALGIFSGKSLVSGTSQKSGLGIAHVPKKWPHESSDFAVIIQLSATQIEDPTIQ